MGWQQHRSGVSLGCGGDPCDGFSGEKEGVLRMPILPNVLMGVGGVSGVEA